MRVALLTPFVVAVTFVACSTFSDAQVAPTPPPVEAGTEAGGEACSPTIVDPASPQECTADFANDPLNCGTCGHACVDRACVEGRCAPDQITNVERSVFAVDGPSLFVAVDTSDIARIDLAKKPFTSEVFFNGVFGPMTYMEAYAGELYVSTVQQPVVIRIADKQQRGNEHFPRVNTKRGDGAFFPGRIAYYEYASDGAGRELARIDTTDGSVRYKKANGFYPVARSGDELFWTETLATGAQIWGAWDDDDEPLVRLGTKVDGFAAEGRAAYFATGELVVRAENGRVTNLAQEAGIGVAAAISGDDLFYVVKRSVPGEDRYVVNRIDKCRGGRPVLVYESSNIAITRIVVEDANHVLVSTAAGIVRARR